MQLMFWKGFTAKRNAILNQVDVKIHNSEYSRDRGFKGTIWYLLLLTPYVRKFREAEIKENVLTMSPHLALLWKMMMPP
jgi:hypothetical protein